MRLLRLDGPERTTQRNMCVWSLHFNRRKQVVGRDAELSACEFINAASWLSELGYAKLTIRTDGELALMMFADNLAGRPATEGGDSGATRRYHLCKNNYSFDALQAYCFGINIKL